MSHVPKYAAALLCALALATTALAESSAEAANWIDRVNAVYDGGPFRLTFESAVSSVRFGKPNRVVTRGTLIQDGSDRFRVETWMETSNPETGSGSSMRMLAVSDGTVIWLEVDQVGADHPQVYRMPVQQLRERASVNVIARNLARMDPVSQIRLLTDTFDFHVAGQSEGSVTLTADVTGEMLTRVQRNHPQSDPESLREVVMIVNESTGFPTAIRFGEPPAMRMSFEDFERLGEVDAGEFRYEVPEGAKIMDLDDAPPVRKEQDGD